MASPTLQPILCCPGLQRIPQQPRFSSKPHTLDSSKHLDFLLQQSSQLPRQNNLQLPLALENYHEGIISVVRIGDPTDQHWPVRWFAAWTNNNQTLGDFVELEHEKVEMAKFEEILENSMSSKIDCYFGECPNYPNLEFYVQYHPLQLKLQWRIPSKKVQISEKTERRTNAPPTPELVVPDLQN